MKRNTSGLLRGRKGTRNKLAIIRTITREVITRIDGWRKSGPFWIPRREKTK